MPNINIAHTSDGRSVQLQFTDPPQAGINVDILATDIGRFVTAILAACVDCAKTTGEFPKLKLKGTDKKKLVYTTAHGMAVVDAVDVAEVAIVVFAIGATELSIGLPKKILRELGSSILMLSADSKSSH